MPNHSPGIRNNAISRTNRIKFSQNHPFYPSHSTTSMNYTEYKVWHSLGKENRTFFRLLNENICTPRWTLASNNNSAMASKIHNSKSGSPQTWDFPEIVLMSMILNAYLFQSNIITDGRVAFQYVQKRQFSLRFDTNSISHHSRAQMH